MEESPRGGTGEDARGEGAGECLGIPRDYLELCRELINARNPEKMVAIILTIIFKKNMDGLTKDAIFRVLNM